MLKPLHATVGTLWRREFIVLSRVNRPRTGHGACRGDPRHCRGPAIVHDQRRDGQAVVTVSVGAAYTRAQTGRRNSSDHQRGDRALYSAKGHNDALRSGFSTRTTRSAATTTKTSRRRCAWPYATILPFVYQPIQNMPHRSHRRRGIADAAEDGRWNTAVAGPVHSRGRTDGRHPGTWALGHSPCLHGSAGTWPRPARQRQCLRHPAQVTRLRAGCFNHPGRNRRARLAARLRNHRRYRHGGAVGCDLAASRPASARHPHIGSTTSGQVSPDFPGCASSPSIRSRSTAPSADARRPAGRACSKTSSD